MKRRMMMRHVAFSTLLLLLFVPAMSADPVTFGSAVIVPGTSWTQVNSYGSSIHLAVDNGMGTNKPYSATLPPDQALQERRVAVTRKVTVGSMSGPKISSIVVEYLSVSVNQVNLTPTFGGKKYLVTMNGSHVTGVIYASGVVPPADEIAFVQIDNANIGQMREMTRTFGGETVVPGSFLSAQDPEDLFDVQSGFNVDAFSMQLVSTAGTGAAQVATFDVSLTVSSSVRKPKNAAQGDPVPFPESSVTINLEGTLRADVTTGRIIDFDFEGPARAGGRKEASADGVKGKAGAGGGQARMMSLTGSGTGFMSGSFTYE